MLALTLTIAQSGDISGVPAEYVKNFMIMFGFIAALGGGVIWGRRGSKGNPIHVEQPVDVNATVTHAPIYAHKSELEAVKADIEHRTRENLRAQTEAAKTLSALLEAGSKREQTIISALHDMEQRMVRSMIDEVKGIHQRINPMEKEISGNSKDIESIKARLANLWEMIQQLWQRVFKSAKA